jgi:acetyl/propionyl-CoA carboxylase alpha subunit
MFRKLLVANRGEIAVRVIRACRDLGIWTVALFDESDRGSLHVRLADESLMLEPSTSYLDGGQIIDLARRAGAEALHPGYGFLAEDASFVRACEEAGIVFVGPPSEVVQAARDKIPAQERVRAAGFRTPLHSSISFGPEDEDLIELEAQELGFPLVVKSCSGGRGRAARLVRAANALPTAVRDARVEAQIVFGDQRLFLEKAILPGNYVEVQVIGDGQGNLIHLGEREGSIQRHNQKLIAESPAPSLTPEQRARLHQMALDIARLFRYRNVGTVEFLMDDKGEFHFTEIKARIQVDHPVTEMISRVDLVKEQICIAAGMPLTQRQETVRLEGWSMQCRINAEDPWNHFLPSPGRLRRFRLPGGHGVRVDTYGYSGCDVPVRYDPILAKVVVWGEERGECVRRMRRALQDFAISGVNTNLPYFQAILEDQDFIAGSYTTEFLRRPLLRRPTSQADLRDLAVAAAIGYLTRHGAGHPVVPQRLQQGWHRSNRQLD